MRVSTSHSLLVKKRRVWLAFQVTAILDRALCLSLLGRIGIACFRLTRISLCELSRSRFQKAVLVTTPFASDPPNQTAHVRSGLTG